MRIQIGKTKYARKGERVVISVDHSGGEDVNELAIFSAGYGDELSPHVQEQIYALVGDRPQMVKPTTVRLTKYRPKSTFEFKVEEDTYFAVMQNADYKTDNQAKARIKRHGIFEQAIKRTLAYAGRLCGYRPASC